MAASWVVPARVSGGRRQQSRDGASVPRDLDGRELPEVRLAHVQHAAKGRGTPLERGQLVPRGAADRQEAQGLGHGRAGHLWVRGGRVSTSSQPRKPCGSPPTLTTLHPQHPEPGTFTSMPPWERWRRAWKG